MLLQKRMFIPKSMQKLMDLFADIEDEDIREIISELIFIESQHRSNSTKNFPMRKVRDTIEIVARLQEERERQESS